jgi:hypothetical protein
MRGARSKEVVQELGLPKGFDLAVTYPVYTMLCGMSLELIYKAIVIAKGNAPNIKSHNLIRLSKDAGLNYDEDKAGLLGIWSESIYWFGRYPVPKKENDYRNLVGLMEEHAYDKEPHGKLLFLTRNGALNWDSFNDYWREAEAVWWEAAAAYNEHPPQTDIPLDFE